ncbi:MAG: hypothetical protein HOY69_25595 [Streptomyces sp.]|nr:hypothetical protein [Streptomyces sp.]
MRADVEEFGRVAGVPPAAGEALPWEPAMRRVGVALPADYRGFVDGFGPGELYARLAVAAPGPLRDGPPGSDGAAALRAFLDDATRTCDVMRGLRDKYPDAFPYAFHPEPGGLLPWGGGIGGEVCFWRPEGDGPDGWTVVVWDQARWRPYPMGMVALMLLAAAGTDDFLRGYFYDPQALVWTPRH